MGFSQKALLQDLRDLGLKEGDKVLVHTSLSKVGLVEDGPEGFVHTIVEAIGENGLAVFPTFTGTSEDSALKPPYFDVLETPSWTGKVPEAARKLPNAIRSLHPTHSVAVIGKDAKNLVDGHEFVDTPCDKNSPFGILAETGGKIILVGVCHNSNTTFHTAEEYANCPYHMLDDPAVCTIVDYQRNEKKLPTKLHRWGTNRDFNRLEDVFLEKGVEKVGLVGKATCRILETGPMLDIIVSYLKKDPYYLVVKD